jgi:SAM-dependent methyltransferase
MVKRYGAGRLVELGGHPWAMTSRLVAEPNVTLEATVSAEEIILWSDEIPVTSKQYEIDIGNGEPKYFRNISANLERTLFPIGTEVDMVLACEIIEHVTRAPHNLLLNINSWLKKDGIVILTTPNGTQLENPFRVRAKMPAFRPSVYSRHNYVFTMDGLVDLVESCGFTVLESKFYSPYTRTGLTNLYRRIYDLGPRYLKNKLAQSLCIVAKKTEARTTASRLPKAYAADAGWDNLDAMAMPASEQNSISLE